MGTNPYDLSNVKHVPPVLGVVLPRLERRIGALEIDVDDIKELIAKIVEVEDLIERVGDIEELMAKLCPEEVEE